MPETCLVTEGVITMVFGVTLTIATSISYLPQQIKIFRKKSAKGISPVFLFLSNTFSFGSLLSTMLIQFNVFSCCGRYDVNFWQCNALLLNIYQIAVMPLNTGLIFLLCVIYADPGAPEGHPDPERYAKKQKLYLYLSAFLFLCLLGYGSYVGALLLLGWGAGSHVVDMYGDIVGGVVLLSTVCQYMPQIYSTFRHKAAGSVSIVTLALQAPGNMAVVIFQLLSGSTFATWLPFLSSFIQQSILLVEVLFFEYGWKKCKERHDNKKDKSINYSNDGYPSSESDENY